MNVQTVKTRKNVARLVKKLWDYKESRGCDRCPENFPPCLEFHHRRGRKIDGDECVSTLAHRTGSWKRIMQEVKKCLLLCANCHRKETYKLGRKKKARERFRAYGRKGAVASIKRRGLACFR
jgi:hypothetical protein